VRDVDGCVTAVLDLETAIVAGSTDTDENDDQDRARRVLRAMVVRLSAAGAEVRDTPDGSTWALRQD
jgi:hypothetical protein